MPGEAREERDREERGIDLNTASEEELTKIPGIGPETARRVVEARPFRSWDDLKDVQGITDRLVEELQRAGARIGEEARRAGGE